MADAPGWLQGRVAIITGAGRGIGRATAEAIARAGAHVVLAARTESQLDAVSETIRKNGGAATVATADVGDSGQVDRLFAIAARVGTPTALVCAAAVLHKAAIDATTPQAWEETLRINLTGTFLCCRAAFGPMRRAGGGRIVNLASLSGIYATEKFPGLEVPNQDRLRRRQLLLARFDRDGELLELRQVTGKLRSQVAGCTRADSLVDRDPILDQPHFVDLARRELG